MCILLLYVHKHFNKKKDDCGLFKLVVQSGTTSQDQPKQQNTKESLFHADGKTPG